MKGTEKERRVRWMRWVALAALIAIGAAAVLWYVNRPSEDVAEVNEEEQVGLAHRDDADFPEGGVTTLDGRPVDTGYRFRYIRQFPACIALFIMPTAKTVRMAGEESAYYRKPFDTAGIRVVDAGDGKTPVDIVLIAPQPDWLKGTDYPNGDELARLRDGLAKGGVAALHIDARQLSRSRLKNLLADFLSVFGHYMLWCIGPTDYVVTANVNVLADEVLGLFSGEKASEAFAATGVYRPAEVMACYMGSDKEIEPGLQELTASERVELTWPEAKRALNSPSPTNKVVAVRAAALMPYYIPGIPWFMRGVADAGVYASMTNDINKYQVARREYMVGFDDIGKGISTNAINRWSLAAKFSPRDPMLLGLVDVIDLKGRQLLRMGNIREAINCYSQLLLIRPKDAAIVHNFALCLKRGGHPEQAAPVFARAVELDPLTDEHRYELIETCAASGHEDIACRQLDVLMKRKPEDPDLRLRAAKLLCLKKNRAYNPERAVQLAEEAAKITGWRTRAYVLGLADVYIECGRVRDGVALKRKMKNMQFDR